MRDWTKWLVIGLAVGGAAGCVAGLVLGGDKGPPPACSEKLFVIGESNHAVECPAGSKLISDGDGVVRCVCL